MRAERRSSGLASSCMSPDGVGIRARRPQYSVQARCRGRSDTARDAEHRVSEALPDGDYAVSAEPL
jgi:hypothetical protein